MTEDQIERRVERMFDALDARLMRGDLTQAAYDAEAAKVSAWAESEYRSGRYRSELTPEGEQLVIPGCERKAKPRERQLGLWG